MKELTLNEVKEVSGGFWQNLGWFIGGYVGGKFLDHFVFNERTFRGLMDNVENSHHRYSFSYYGFDVIRR